MNKFLRPYQCKKKIMADLYFGGWSEDEQYAIVDLIIAGIERGWTSTQALQDKYKDEIIVDQGCK